MKAQHTISYTYDPQQRALGIYTDGKLKGGLYGPVAERKFNRLLLTGANISITTMETDQKKKSLIRIFHAILAKQGILKWKEQIIGYYGVAHTTELTTEQLQELVNEYGQQKLKQPDTARIRTLRSDILTLCNKLGVYVTNNDWTKVNAFMMDKRIAGKQMWQMTEEELVTCRKKLNSILYKHMNATSEIERQQLMN